MEEPLSPAKTPARSAAVEVTPGTKQRSFSVDLDASPSVLAILNEKNAVGELALGPQGLGATPVRRKRSEVLIPDPAEPSDCQQANHVFLCSLYHGTVGKVHPGAAQEVETDAREHS